MGRDKALLPYRGVTLVESVAAAVREASGCVTIVGSPEKYESLGLRVIADTRLGCGPLAGIETALWDSPAEWVLIAACDMPGISAGFFRCLLDAGEPGFGAVIPRTPDGRLHPLAAAYNRGAAPSIAAALDRGIRKVLDALTILNIKHLEVSELANANTPEEWAARKD
jgi:molybdopterin-guanine dinucleotide biosynthesis protein A